MTGGKIMASNGVYMDYKCSLWYRHSKVAISMSLYSNSV